MGQYRKKPIVIEARQFTDIADIGGPDGIGAWMGNPTGELDAAAGLTITTLEGVMQASIGDWIIKGVNGEFYPIRNDIFEKTYEAMQDDD